MRNESQLLDFIIKNYPDTLKDNKFNYLYEDLWNHQDFTLGEISLLTVIFHKADIPVLSYLKESIPTGFLVGVSYQEIFNSDTLKIPDGIEVIQQSALVSAKGLKKLYLPYSIRQIASMSLSSSLTDIYYPATYNELDTIVRFKFPQNSDLLGSCVLHCSDIDVKNSTKPKFYVYAYQPDMLTTEYIYEKPGGLEPNDLDGIIKSSDDLWAFFYGDKHSPYGILRTGIIGYECDKSSLHANLFDNYDDALECKYYLERIIRHFKSRIPIDFELPEIFIATIFD